VFEITNHTASRIFCSLHGPSRPRATSFLETVACRGPGVIDIEPHNTKRLDFGMTQGTEQITASGLGFITNTWVRRLARFLERVGFKIDLTQKYSLSINETNTGWVHATKMDTRQKNR